MKSVTNLLLVVLILLCTSIIDNQHQARQRGLKIIDEQAATAKRDDATRDRQIQILAKLDDIKAWQDAEMNRRTADRYTAHDAARDLAPIREAMHLTTQP